MNGWQAVVGHSGAVEILAAAVTHARIGHAYLFSGPDQIGKTTLARCFAMAINCTAAPAQRPCATCRNCTLIAADRHPDVRLLGPEVSARGKPSIKIDAIRELQRGLQLAPYEGRSKVAIVTQFESANPNAANAFLKTLEEPPGDTVIILTAADADALLETIRSRCRVVPLRPIPAADIYQALVTRRRVPADQAQLLSQLAGGRLGWAFNAVDNPALLAARRAQLDLLHTLLAADLVTRFKLVDKLAQKPEDAPPLLQTWQTWWRDLLLMTHQMPQTAIINRDEHDRYTQLAAQWGAAAVHDCLRQTQQALWQIERNVNLRLALENLLLAYPTAVTT